jgi:hypothetical protein
MDDKPEELPAIDDTTDLHDHPDEVTPEEMVEGITMYFAVDDMDDESNGLDP